MTENISDIVQYVQGILARGTEPFCCVKIAQIKAREGIVGETVVTKLKNGHIETENCNIEKGDMIVTNPFGEEYVVKADIFKNKYKINPNNPEQYCSKVAVQQFLRLTEDICFKAPWGQKMYMKKGDFINITGLNTGDVYGVAQEEFFNTYEQV